jgi:hypothetical protein
MRNYPVVAFLRPLMLSAAVLFGWLAAESRPAIADDATAQATSDAAAADPDAWRFRTTAYGWAMSVVASVRERNVAPSVLLLPRGQPHRRHVAVAVVVAVQRRDLDR